MHKQLRSASRKLLQRGNLQDRGKRQAVLCCYVSQFNFQSPWKADVFVLVGSKGKPQKEQQECLVVPGSKRGAVTPPVISG